MAYVLCLIYVAVSYIRPAELNPAFIPYHVAEVTGVLALAGALFSVLLRPRPVLNLPIDWCFLGFIAVAFVADPLGASVARLGLTAQVLLPLAAFYVLIRVTVETRLQMRVFIVVLCMLAVFQAVNAAVGYSALSGDPESAETQVPAGTYEDDEQPGQAATASRRHGDVRRSERPGDQPADRRAVSLQRRAVGRLRRGASNRRARRAWRDWLRVSARAVERRVPRPGRARWRLRVSPGGAGGDRRRAGGGRRGRPGRRPEPFSEHRLQGSLGPGPHRGLGGGPADGESPSDTRRRIQPILTGARARGAQLVRARSCGTRACRRIPVHRRVLLAFRLHEQDEEHGRRRDHPPWQATCSPAESGS